MDPSCRILIILATVSLLFLGFPIKSQGINPLQVEGRELFEKVKVALWHPEGREFEVQWDYGIGEDAWKENGSLKILGRDYLQLSLPQQDILIRESVLMTRFRETDQVIIDRFDRNDPGNIFSLLLGEWDSFKVVESRQNGEFTVLLVLKNETQIGFAELEISVDTRSWLPNSILGKLDDDMTIRIEVFDSGRLEDPDGLKSSTLEGSEIIDLRE